MATTCLLLLSLICFLPSFALSRATTVKDVDQKSLAPNHGSVGFLQNLVGTQKGDTVEGLRHLKQYLHRFGYLETYSVPSSSQLDTSTTYDDLLESAIKTYQLNYNLNVTGKLDARTVAQMMKPRCGVPDIINGTRTSMNSGKPHHHHHHHHHHQRTSSTLPHVVMHYRIPEGRPTWKKTQLTYAFLNSATALRSVTASAFGKWSAVTQFSFQEVQNPETADITIGFFAGQHGDNAAFDGPGGTLAHAYYPTLGLFHLDAEENWSGRDQPRLDEMDLESVSVHEMGHLLGLDHSSDVEAIMYPTIAYGVVKRELTQDDIDGISDLYNL